MSKRKSVEATYDSVKDGFQYRVATSVNGKHVSSTKIADPFVNHSVNISFLDTLKGLFRGGVKIHVSVYGAREVMEDVMELDNQYIGANRTRKQDWDKSLNQKLSDHITREMGEL